MDRVVNPMEDIQFIEYITSKGRSKHLRYSSVVMDGVWCIFFLVICVSVSNARVAPRIVGGGPAALGQFPWMVSLRGAVSSSHFCGGNFVTRQHILTAAHCIIGTAPTAMYVVSGSISNAEGGEVHSIADVRVHEDYIGRPNAWRDDIGILKLTSPVELTATRMLLPLPTRDIVGGEDCVMSGWGRLHYPSLGLPAHQQYLHLNALGSDACRAIWGEDVIVSAHLCGLATAGLGICSGDSGSPLVCNGEHAGISSWVNPCANGLPDVYVRVWEYRDWIAEHSNDIDLWNARDDQ